MSTWVFSKYHSETIQLSYDTTFLGSHRKCWTKAREKRVRKQAGTEWTELREPPYYIRAGASGGCIAFPNAAATYEKCQPNLIFIKGEKHSTCLGSHNCCQRRNRAESLDFQVDALPSRQWLSRVGSTSSLSIPWEISYQRWGFSAPPQTEQETWGKWSPALCACTGSPGACDARSGLRTTGCSKDTCDSQGVGGHSAPCLQTVCTGDIFSCCSWEWDSATG